MNAQDRLLQYLENQVGFASDAVARAFKTVDRAEFVLPENREHAYFDYPLPIGFGQTISQPSTVLFMLNLLDAKPGDKVLDIGSGSGWTTVLLARMVGKKGRVYGLEIVPELKAFGAENLQKFNLPQAEILQAQKGKDGLPKQAPFDRILVSASADNVPKKLIGQLKIGGRLVLPVKNSVWRIDRISKNQTQAQEFPGFVFVPLL